MLFTKKKFCSLPLTSQHKKISEGIMELLNHFDPERFAHLQQLEQWAQVDSGLTADFESLSNSYHLHLRGAKQSVSEHRLLVKKKDKESPARDWLDCVIYFDQLRSAHNIGNMIRTIEAFRLGKVCFSKNMAVLSHPQVVKTAMGAASMVQEVPCDFEKFPAPLIAIETHQKATALHKFKFPSSFTLIMGNEEYGVSEPLLEAADHIVEVPLWGQKNSLNVAACMAIIAWKIDQDLREVKD